MTDAVVPLPTDTPLPGTPDAAFDLLASVVRRVLHVPVALVSLVDRERQVFPGAVGLPEPWSTSRTTPLSHSFCQHVVARARPFVVTDARADPLVAENLAVPEIGVVAYAGMPVVDGDGVVVGSLCAIDTEPREWTEGELALLRDLAVAASAELQLRAAVASADRASRRWRVLSALSEALATPTGVDEVADVVTRASRTWVGATSGRIAVLDATGDRLVALGGSEPGVVVAGAGVVSAISDDSAALVVAHRAPTFTTEPDGTSAASMPLQLGGRVLGALTLLWDTPQAFDDDERGLLLGLARYTAQALDRALLLAERRDVARTLQTALLPTLPDVGWLEVAGRYLPAHLADAVGGDWFDAFTGGTRADGSEHLTVVVGDVTGHDTAAAAVMGRLQATLRTLAVDNPDSPDRLLARLDHVMARTGVDRMATAVAGSLTATPDGTVALTWSNAGHLPPLHLACDVPATFLERPVDLLLGLHPHAPRRTHTTVLAPGDTLLLFTDGLVERRGQSLDEGLASLAYAAAAHRDLPLPDLLDRIVEVASAGGHDDDLVVFGLRVPTPGPMS